MDTTQLDTVTAANAENNAITAQFYLKIVYIAIGLVGLVGNSLVIFIIFSTTSMRKVVTNTFIINQSIVDGLAGLFLILVTIFEDNGRNLSGTFDEIYCRVWLTRAPLWATFMNSSLNLVFITIERLVAVWKPVWYKTSFSRKKAFLIMTLGWLVGPFVTFLYGGVTSVIVDGNCYVYSLIGETNLFLGFMLVGLQFLIPITMFTVGYSGIALLLHQKQKLLNQSQAPGISNQGKAKVQGGRNMIKTMAIVCLCFVLCWSVNQIYYLMYITGHSIDFDSPFYHFSVVAVFCNCCCNPFVYVCKYREFKKAMKKLFNCRATQVNPEQRTTMETTGM